MTLGRLSPTPSPRPALERTRGRSMARLHQSRSMQYPAELSAFIDMGVGSRLYNEYKGVEADINIDERDYDPVDLARISQGFPLTFMAMMAIERNCDLQALDVDSLLLFKFLEEVEASYRRNCHFHTSLHGADVVHAIHYLLQCLRPEVRSLLTQVHVFAIIVAAATHDSGHPMMSNVFHSKFGTRFCTRALEVGNTSYLEEYHLARATSMIKNHGLTDGLDREDTSLFWEVLASAIRGTDLGLHGQILTRVGAIKANELPQVVDVAQMCIKLADLSNVTRPWCQAVVWSRIVCNEFFHQGDVEGSRGEVCSPNTDRANTHIPSFQLAFLQRLVQPLLDMFQEHFGRCEVMEENLRENIRRWTKADEACPAPNVYTFQFDDGSPEASNLSTILKYWPPSPQQFLYPIHDASYRGYRLTRAMAQNNQNSLLAGVDASGSGVVVKVLSDAHDASTEGKFLRLAGLQDWIVEENIFTDQQSVLVTKALPGHSVRHHQEFYQALGWDEILAIVVSAGEALAKLHQCNMIHGDISPDNIMWDPEEGVANIIDFGMAALVSRATKQSSLSCFTMRGTPAYMSPEQTGRTSMVCEQRSDVYSLGGVLYFLVVGRDPYKGSLGEIISKVLSTPPPDPNVILHSTPRRCPRTICDIIQKAMAKSITQRYSTVDAMLYDLKLCLESVRETGAITDFAVGSKNAAPYLQYNPHPYGIEDGVNKVVDCFRCTLELGPPQMCVVSGLSGSGKTSLTQCAMSKIEEINAGVLVGHGKFDQLFKSDPHAPLLQAISQLLKAVMEESADNRKAVLNSVMRHLQDHMKLACDVFDNLKELLQLEEMEVPEGGNVREADVKNLEALHWMLVRMVTGIGAAGRPVVIFIDDLQWSGFPMVHVMEEVMMAEESDLLFIGTYRAEEVHPEHVVALTLERLAKRRVSFTSINVEPLQVMHVESLLRDAMYLNDEEEASLGLHRLAELIHLQSGGNPLYIQNHLAALGEQGSLWFEAGAWKWDLEAIGRCEVAPSVVELIREEYLKLPEEYRRVVGCGSLFGDQIKIDLVCELLDTPEQDVMKAITAFISVGAITIYGTPPVYSFAHDQIRAAVRLTVDRGLMREWLWRGGVVSFLGCRDSNDEEMYLRSAAWIMESIGEGHRGDHQDLVLECLVMAGRAGLACGAYAQADDYWRGVTELVPRGEWSREDRRDVIMEALKNRLILARRTAAPDYDKVHGIYSAAADLAQTSTEWARVSVLFWDWGGIGHVEPVTLSMCKEMRRFGYYLTPNPSTPRIVGEVMMTKARMATMRNWMDIVTRFQAQGFQQQCTEYRKVEGDILTVGMSLTIRHKDGLFPIMVCKTVRHGLTYGYSDGFVCALAFYAVILILKFNDVGGARSILEVVDVLAEQMTSAAFMGLLTTIRLHTLSMWVGPCYNACLQQQKQALSIMYKGCYDYPVFTMYFAAWAAMFYASALGEVKHMIQLCEASLPYRVPVNLENHKVLLHLYRTFTTLSAWDYDHCAFETEDSPDTQFALKNGYKIIAFHVFHYRALTLYLWGANKEALSQAEATHELWEASVTGNAQPYHLLVYCLCILSSWDEITDPSQRRQCKGIVKSSLQFLRGRTEYNSNDISPSIEMIEGIKCIIEGSTVDGNPLDRMKRAVVMAEESGIQLQMAMFAEVLAREMTKQTEKPDSPMRGTLASTEIMGMLDIAYGAYRRWGCAGKSRELSNLMAEMTRNSAPTFSVPKKPASTSASADSSSRSTENTSHMPSTNKSAHRSAVDEHSHAQMMIKGIRAISNMVDPHAVVEEVTKVLHESTGAEKSIFVHARGDWRANRAGLLIMHAIGPSLEFSEPISAGSDAAQDLLLVNMIMYTLTQDEAVIIDDAGSTTHPAVKGSRYVERHGTKSIMCIPFHRGSEVSGAFYVENNVGPKMFNAAHTRIAQVLMNQAVMSIEHASVYFDMKKQASLFNRFVPKEFFDLMKCSSLAEVDRGAAIEQRLSLLMCDIRDFTRLSEGFTPTEVFDFVNVYLDVMEPIIRHHGGFIDKYIGDGILALFLDEDSALMAAAGMVDAAKNLPNKSKIATSVRIGVSVHTGPVMMGVVGSDSRVETTVMGDVVNTVARLESLTKLYRVPILISGQTYRGLRRLSTEGQLLFREVDVVVPKGKENPVRLYEVMSPKDDLDRAYICSEVFKRAKELYTRGHFNDAKSLFQQCVEESKGRDQTALMFVERCEELLIKFSVVTSETWNGVWRLVNK